MDIELVTVGPSHAEQLRSIWLEMLAGSPGVFYEQLEEALALGSDDWRDRAAGFTSGTSTAIAAVRDGSFAGIISGYVDRVGMDAEGLISNFHVVASRDNAPPIRDFDGAATRMLLQAFAEWLARREVRELYVGVREDRVGLLDLLLGLGFVPTGARRRSETDADCDEVELVCMLSVMTYDTVLHPATGAQPARPGVYRYRGV